MNDESTKKCAENQRPAPKGKTVRFIVRREFAGTMTMREAFEAMITSQAEKTIDDWLEKAG